MPDHRAEPMATGPTRRGVLAAAVAGAGAGGTMLASAALAARGAAIRATIDARRTGTPVTPMLYGALQEHIGDLINHGLWAELLADRKFFHPVQASDAPAPPDGASARAGGRAAGSPWRALPNSDVAMVAADAYAGDHSPAIRLDPARAAGIGQGDVPLAARRHVGRVVIDAPAGVRVRVALAWGAGPDERATMALPAAAAGWRTVPIAFDVPVRTLAGRIEISATGTGRLRVGAVSLMPADHVRGFRRDTLDLVRGLRSGMWRVPGGNYVSGYDWRDTVGDPDRRPSRWDHAWDALQPNDVGIDELLDYCGMIGAAPMLCVNAGFGDAREAAALVGYVNGGADSAMGARRAANGRAAPWGVRLWNIGNEMYGPWQLGAMAPDQYMLKHNLFADAMRAVDPTITLIAVGAMPDELAVDEIGRRANAGDPAARDRTEVAYGSPGDWTYRLIERCSGRFDLISEHCYGDARRFDPLSGRMLPGPVAETVLESCRRPANRIRLKREYWDRYLADFPALRRTGVRLSIDEWGFRGASGLKQTLGLALALNELIRQSDMVAMAGFTMGTSWLSHDRLDATYSNAGLLFRLYRDHLEMVPVTVGGDSPMPRPRWPAGGDQPVVDAGSPTWPLDLVATTDARRRSLTIAAVNATDAPVRAAVTVAGFAMPARAVRHRLTGATLAATNRVGRPAEVAVTQQSVDIARDGLLVAPYSVEVYRIAAA